MDMNGHCPHDAVEALASALSEQCSRTNGEELRDRVLHEAVEAVMGEELTQVVSSTSSSQNDLEALQNCCRNKFEMLDDSVRLAAVYAKEKSRCDSISNKKPKEESSCTTQPVSFYLLNSFQGLPEFVTAEQLQEAHGDEHLLVLLNKIQHVDDVQYAWNETVLPILSEGLGSFPKEYMKLSRTWFGQCDTGSMEHLLVRHDLCLAVARAIASHCATTTSPRDSDDNETHVEALFSLIQTWHDIFLSLLPFLHSLPESEESSMAGILWSLFVSNSEVPILFAIMDPYAAWFAGWLAQLPHAQVVEILVNTNLIPYLLRRKASLCLYKKFNKEILMEALLVQSLAMLKSILVKTRVALFPWHQVTIEASTTLTTTSATNCVAASAAAAPVPPSLSQIKMLLDTALCVLEAGVREPELVSDKLVDVCRVMIETVLQGCCNYDFYPDLLSWTVDRLKSALREDAPSGRNGCQPVVVQLMELCQRIDWHVKMMDRNHAPARLPDPASTFARID